MEIIYQVAATGFKAHYKFKTHVNDQSVTLVSSTSNKAFAQWAAMDCHRCEHCQLQQATCPVAANLAELAPIAWKFRSFDTLKTRLSAADGRVLYKEVTAQQLLTSMAGILMSGAGPCDKVSFLFPMVLFHHPFASQDESVYRSVANLALKFVLTGAQEPFEHFVEHHYRSISIVNRQMVERLREAGPEYEALVNALVNLEMFVKELRYLASTQFSELNESLHL